MIHAPMTQATVVIIETSHVNNPPGQRPRLVIHSKDVIKGRFFRRNTYDHSAIADELRTILGINSSHLPQGIFLSSINFSLRFDYCVEEISRCHDFLTRRAIGLYASHDCSDISLLSDSLEQFTVQHLGVQRLSVEDIARILLGMVDEIQHFVPFATIVFSERPVVKSAHGSVPVASESSLIGITSDWQVVPAFIADYLESKRKSEEYCQQLLDSLGVHD